MMAKNSDGALTGIKVLDLSRMLPGPYCSMVLADHGADVIAIENRILAGDGLFVQDLNRNKRHMFLNLKSVEGHKIFFKLAAKADVVIEGFRPGVVQRLGVDYDAIKAINHDVIYCSISGYGQTGSRKMAVGHDVNYLSEAGILNLIGGAGQPPSIPGVQIADIAGGSMNAALGILLALFARNRGCGGQYIDISMTDGILGLLTLANRYTTQNDAAQKRSEELLSHKYGCYNTYETQDGKYLSIGALEPKFWERLCSILGLPALIESQYNDLKREDVVQTLRKKFRSKSLEEWNNLLGNEDVCFSPVKTLEEVRKDPLFQERDMVYSYGGDDGKLHYGFGVPVKLGKNKGTIRSKPCQAGEHTHEILQELGYSKAEIDALNESGVI